MRWTPESTDAERGVAKKLRASSRFYRFLWEIREELFADGFEEELIASYQPRGQEPCPPAMLAMAVLLQRYDKVSDADAVEAAENDRRWQLVLGTLGHDSSPFGQGTLVRFRTRMMAHELDRKLLDRTVELAKKSGGFGWKNLRVALDSSPLHGAGRVEDSWNLIGRAMAKVVHAVSLVLTTSEEDVIEEVGLPVLSASSVKSAIDIDWDDGQAKHEALNELLGQVTRLQRWVQKKAREQSSKPPLKDALAMLKRVVEQDTEPDPPLGGRRITEGVAVDRLISLSDPEMRHGRKSRSKRFDGYKRHIIVANGLILATAIEPANVAEHAPTQRLLQAAQRHGALAVIDIDRGYLGSSAIEQLDRDGVRISARPWPVVNNGFFTKLDFHLQLRRGRVECPAGATARIDASGQARFAPTDCADCALKAKCTSAPVRSITVHPQEALMIKLRNSASTKAGRKQLRQRVGVEHRLARISAIQGSRARYSGKRKNELDLNRAAAVANLLTVAYSRAA
jgi:hypothetical protein